MAKTAGEKAALSSTLKSRKAKATARESRGKTASKSARTPADEGERTTKGEARSADDVLSAFDLELRYGPCAGLTRLERWERAKMLGFEPPESVCELIKELPADQQISVFGRL